MRLMPDRIWATPSARRARVLSDSGSEATSASPETAKQATEAQHARRDHRPLLHHRLALGHGRRVREEGGGHLLPVRRERREVLGLAVAERLPLDVDEGRELYGALGSESRGRLGACGAGWARAAGEASRASANRRGGGGARALRGSRLDTTATRGVETTARARGGASPSDAFPIRARHRRDAGAGSAARPRRGRPARPRPCGRPPGR